MDLTFHIDWASAAHRMDAFWQGQSTDRPAILLTVPKPQGERIPVPEPEGPEQKYFDPEFVLRRCEAELGNSWHMAESLPAATRAMMAGWLPTYGSRIVADDATIWIDQIIESWDRVPDWESAWDDQGWRRLLGLLEYLVQHAKGRFFVGCPPMLPPNDLLSMLRGCVGYLFDLADHPDEIKHAQSIMTRNYLRMFDTVNRVCHTQFEGYHEHYPVWSREPLITTQSDISCTLSEAMFEEFIVPELEQIMGHTGRAIYHLDGPDAIKHLDRVLDIPGMAMLQWVSGAGQPGGFQHWAELFDRAQEHGKAILLPCGVDQLEQAVQRFRPELTYIWCGEVPTRRQADEVLLNLERWTRKYWGRR